MKPDMKRRDGPPRIQSRKPDPSFEEAAREGMQRYEPLLRRLAKK